MPGTLQYELNTQEELKSLRIVLSKTPINKIALFQQDDIEQTITNTSPDLAAPILAKTFVENFDTQRAKTVFAQLLNLATDNKHQLDTCTIKGEFTYNSEQKKLFYTTTYEDVVLKNSTDTETFQIPGTAAITYEVTEEKLDLVNIQTNNKLFKEVLLEKFFNSEAVQLPTQVKIDALSFESYIDALFSALLKLQTLANQDPYDWTKNNKKEVADFLNYLAALPTQTGRKQEQLGYSKETIEDGLNVHALLDTSLLKQHKNITEELLDFVYHSLPLCTNRKDQTPTGILGTLFESLANASAITKNNSITFNTENIISTTLIQTITTLKDNPATQKTVADIRKKIVQNPYPTQKNLLSTLSHNNLYLQNVIQDILTAIQLWVKKSGDVNQAAQILEALRLILDNKAQPKHVDLYEKNIHLFPNHLRQNIGNIANLHKRLQLTPYFIKIFNEFVLDEADKLQDHDKAKEILTLIQDLFINFSEDKAQKLLSVTEDYQNKIYSLRENAYGMALKFPTDYNFIKSGKLDADHTAFCQDIIIKIGKMAKFNDFCHKIPSFIHSNTNKKLKHAASSAYAAILKLTFSADRYEPVNNQALLLLQAIHNAYVQEKNEKDALLIITNCQALAEELVAISQMSATDRFHYLIGRFSDCKKLDEHEINQWSWDKFNHWQGDRNNGCIFATALKANYFSSHILVTETFHFACKEVLADLNAMIVKFGHDFDADERVKLHKACLLATFIKNNTIIDNKLLSFISSKFPLRSPKIQETFQETLILFKTLQDNAEHESIKALLQPTEITKEYIDTLKARFCNENELQPPLAATYKNNKNEFYNYPRLVTRLVDFSKKNIVLAKRIDTILAVVAADIEQTQDFNTAVKILHALEGLLTHNFVGLTKKQEYLEQLATKNILSNDLIEQINPMRDYLDHYKKLKLEKLSSDEPHLGLTAHLTIIQNDATNTQNLNRAKEKLSTLHGNALAYKETCLKIMSSIKQLPENTSFFDTAKNTYIVITDDVANAHIDYVTATQLLQTLGKTVATQDTLLKTNPKIKLLSLIPTLADPNLKKITSIAFTTLEKLSQFTINKLTISNTYNAVITLLQQPSTATKKQNAENEIKTFAITAIKKLPYDVYINLLFNSIWQLQDADPFDQKNWTESTHKHFAYFVLLLSQFKDVYATAETTLETTLEAWIKKVFADKPINAPMLQFLHNTYHYYLSQQQNTTLLKTINKALVDLTVERTKTDKQQLTAQVSNYPAAKRQLQKYLTTCNNSVLLESTQAVLSAADSHFTDYELAAAYLNDIYRILEQQQRLKTLAQSKSLLAPELINTIEENNKTFFSNYEQKFQNIPNCAAIHATFAAALKVNYYSVKNTKNKVYSTILAIAHQSKNYLLGTKLLEILNPTPKPTPNPNPDPNAPPDKTQLIKQRKQQSILALLQAITELPNASLKQAAYSSFSAIEIWVNKNNHHKDIKEEVAAESYQKITAQLNQTITAHLQKTFTAQQRQEQEALQNIKEITAEINLDICLCEKLVPSAMEECIHELFALLTHLKKAAKDDPAHWHETQKKNLAAFRALIVKGTEKYKVDSRFYIMAILISKSITIDEDFVDFLLSLQSCVQDPQIGNFVRACALVNAFSEFKHNDKVKPILAIKKVDDQSIKQLETFYFNTESDSQIEEIRQKIEEHRLNLEYKKTYSECLNSITNLSARAPALKDTISVVLQKLEEYIQKNKKYFHPWNILHILNRLFTEDNLAYDTLKNIKEELAAEDTLSAEFIDEIFLKNYDRKNTVARFEFYTDKKTSSAVQNAINLLSFSQYSQLLFASFFNVKKLDPFAQESWTDKNKKDFAHFSLLLSSFNQQIQDEAKRRGIKIDSENSRLGIQILFQDKQEEIDESTLLFLYQTAHYNTKHNISCSHLHVADAFGYLYSMKQTGKTFPVIQSEMLLDPDLFTQAVEQQSSVKTGDYQQNQVAKLNDFPEYQRQLLIYVNQLPDTSFVKKTATAALTALANFLKDSQNYIAARDILEKMLDFLEKNKEENYLALLDQELIKSTPQLAATLHKVHAAVKYEGALLILKQHIQIFNKTQEQRSIGEKIATDFYGRTAEESIVASAITVYPAIEFFTEKTQQYKFATNLLSYINKAILSKTGALSYEKTTLQLLDEIYRLQDQNYAGQDTYYLPDNDLKQIAIDSLSSVVTWAQTQPNTVLAEKIFNHMLELIKTAKKSNSPYHLEKRQETLAAIKQYHSLSHQLQALTTAITDLSNTQLPTTLISDLSANANIILREYPQFLKIATDSLQRILIANNNKQANLKTIVTEEMSKFKKLVSPTSATESQDTPVALDENLNPIVIGEEYLQAAATLKQNIDNFTNTQAQRSNREKFYASFNGKTPEEHTIDSATQAHAAIAFFAEKTQLYVVATTLLNYINDTVFLKKIIPATDEILVIDLLKKVFVLQQNEELKTVATEVMNSFAGVIIWAGQDQGRMRIKEKVIQDLTKQITDAQTAVTQQIRTAENAFVPPSRIQNNKRDKIIENIKQDYSLPYQLTVLQTAITSLANKNLSVLEGILKIADTILRTNPRFLGTATDSLQRILIAIDNQQTNIETIITEETSKLQEIDFRMAKEEFMVLLQQQKDPLIRKSANILLPHVETWVKDPEEYRYQQTASFAILPELFPRIKTEKHDSDKHPQQKAAAILRFCQTLLLDPIKTDISATTLFPPVLDTTLNSFVALTKNITQFDENKAAILKLLKENNNLLSYPSITAQFEEFASNARKLLAEFPQHKEHIFSTLQQINQLFAAELTDISVSNYRTQASNTPYPAELSQLHDFRLKLADAAEFVVTHQLMTKQWLAAAPQEPHPQSEQERTVQSEEIQPEIKKTNVLEQMPQKILQKILDTSVDFVKQNPQRHADATKVLRKTEAIRVEKNPLEKYNRITAYLADATSYNASKLGGAMTIFAGVCTIAVSPLCLPALLPLGIYLIYLGAKQIEKIEKNAAQQTFSEPMTFFGNTSKALIKKPSEEDLKSLDKSLGVISGTTTTIKKLQ